MRVCVCARVCSSDLCLCVYVFERGCAYVRVFVCACVRGFIVCISAFVLCFFFNMSIYTVIDDFDTVQWDRFYAGIWEL